MAIRLTGATCRGVESSKQGLQRNRRHCSLELRRKRLIDFTNTLARKMENKLLVGRPNMPKRRQSAV